MYTAANVLPNSTCGVRRPNSAAPIIALECACCDSIDGGGKPFRSLVISDQLLERDYYDEHMPQ